MKTLAFFILCHVALGQSFVFAQQTNPSTRVFRSAAEILNSVPVNIIVKPHEDLNMAAVKQANDYLRQAAVAKKAELRWRIEKIQEAKTKGYPAGFIAYGPGTKLRRGADTVLVYVCFYFNSTNAAMVSRIKPNSDVTALGNIRAAEYRVGKKGSVSMVIDLTECEVR